MNKTLSSPNTMIWEYFKGLRRLVSNIHIHSQEEQKQEIALSIFLAITVVEAFLNIYFRIVVEEEPYKTHRKNLIDNLSDRKSLDYKIKNWPKDILGKNLNIDTGVGKDFINLKEKRNKLMHFKSSYESIAIEDINILGLADTSVYDSLTVNDAIFALDTAEKILEEIFRCRGIEEEKIPGMMHLWTGKILA